MRKCAQGSTAAGKGTQSYLLEYRSWHCAPATSCGRILHFENLARVEMNINIEKRSPHSVDIKIIKRRYHPLIVLRNYDEDNPSFHYGAVVHTRRVGLHWAMVNMGPR